MSPGRSRRASRRIAVTVAVGALATAGPITGLAGKCVDVAGASSANGTHVQLYDCNGTNA